MRILLLNGPNLNMLGTREPEQYGSTTLAEIEEEARALAAELGAELDCFQSNHEGELVERVQQARGSADAIIINPGAFAHTSVSLADAIAAVDIPTFEVHISNIYKREEFRRHSYIAPVAVGQISGLGAHGYCLAVRAAAKLLGA